MWCVVFFNNFKVLFHCAQSPALGEPIFSSYYILKRHKRMYKVLIYVIENTI